MLRRTALTAGQLSALLLLAGCGGATAVRLAEPRGTLHAHVGDELVITFRVQPGVGYAWTLISNQPAAVLTLESDRFKAEHPGLVGGAGNEVFTFNGREAGTAVLTFHHAFRGTTIEDRRVVVILS
jgi:predicted secreted protein